MGVAYKWENLTEDVKMKVFAAEALNSKTNTTKDELIKMIKWIYNEHFAHYEKTLLLAEIGVSTLNAFAEGGIMLLPENISDKAITHYSELLEIDRKRGVKRNVYTVEA